MQKLSNINVNSIYETVTNGVKMMPVWLKAAGATAAVCCLLGALNVLVVIVSIGILSMLSCMYSDKQRNS